MKKIALISTPWPLFNRPSIQLASLKAFIRHKLPEVAIKNYHIYLSIASCLGYEFYSKVSESTWLSEPLYGALLYPEKKGVIKKLWNRYASKIIKKERPEFEDICDILKSESESIINNVDWNDYIIIGFSICFSQLTSSLYFIREIKKRAPDTKIVIGGASCAGDMGRSLICVYPDIDFVIQGEGELPLYYLIKCLAGSQKIKQYPGIISRSYLTENSLSQIEDLDELPIPDYSDYFEEIKRLTKKRPLQPRLPMEISRGCWWRRCNFCNLNSQWKGYRSKSPKRVKDELNRLVERYQILSISFMDNLLPPNSKEIFEDLDTLAKDLRLFAEIRANTSIETLRVMRRAGVTDVQVGIEALSSRLLKKMNKGTTAINNIEIMKNCETMETPRLTGNLILQFPGSDENDVKETMNNLDYVFSFHPLKGIPFWLGYGSRVWEDPSSFKIKKMRNHKNYSFIFPSDILDKLVLIIQGYYGQIKEQKKIWRPVKEKLRKWERFYKKMHEMPQSEPILSYQDGGDFLIIRQRISQDQNMIHKLKGLSRRIYLYCQHTRSLNEILMHFQGLNELRLMPFLNMMKDKKLMFSEGDRYLSLAVPSRGWRR